jgi:beta-glucanase (GH16 family)
MKYLRGCTVVSHAASGLLAVACCGVMALTALPASAQAPPGYSLTWSDEFNGAVGSSPSSSHWSYDTGAGGWGNNEQETYVTSVANSHVISDSTGTDGLALQIEAQTDSSGRWYSARIKSSGHVSVGPYGYIEYRCKFPAGGQGYWPAGWMLGTNLNSVGWPSCGEIDIAEEVNSQSNNHGSLHAPNWNPTAAVNASNATSTYHNYGANWTSTGVTFYVDGRSYYTATSGSAPRGGWVFTKSQFLLINLAIGGTFPGDTNGSTKDDGNFDIDYVRVYEPG